MSFCEDCASNVQSITYLQGNPYQPKFSGPASYLEDQKAVRRTWWLQIFLDLKVANSATSLAHWPEEDQSRLQRRAMLDFLDIFPFPEYEQEQLITIVNFATKLPENNQVRPKTN